MNAVSKRIYVPSAVTTCKALISARVQKVSNCQMMGSTVKISTNATPHLSVPSDVRTSLVVLDVSVRKVILGIRLLENVKVMLRKIG